MIRFVLFLFFVASIGICEAQNLKLELVRTFNGHAHGARRVVFSPDVKTFASGGTRGELFIWDLVRDGAIKKLEGHYGSIVDVRYSRDGKYLVSAGEEGQIKVWDTKTGLCLQQIVIPSSDKSEVNKVSFALISPTSDMVFFGGTNGDLYRVPISSKAKPEVLYSDPNQGIRCAVVCPDGREVIYAAGKYLMALDLATSEVVREYNTGDCMINSLKFSADGNRLLTWCDNSRVDVRDPSNFYLLTSFRPGTGERKFSNIAFTEDQKSVVTVDHASRFNIWNLESKRRVLDQGADQGTVMSFDLENGMGQILSGSLDKSIKLWRIVPDIPEETKKKKKPEPEPVIVEPEVEIIVYEKPIEDVKQIEIQTPVNTNIVSKPEIVTPNVLVSVDTIRSNIESILPERKNNRRVKPIRKEHRLTLLSHQLTFEIWDSQVVDGDIVSIYIDEICIVEEYSITAEKRVIEFDASGYKKAYLYLHAHNLGTIAPNTVTMTISDGIQTLDVELRSDLTGSSAMELNFEDKTASE
ncbi:MAG: WD40 repeat domain-containing protein [Flavobacteriales bacterium]|nr:WD40 repeat domain-containing protein [Flavobacteriales bacterium]